MLKILHRVNDPQRLSTLDNTIGVEMDIHAYGDRLVVHHDAFSDGPDLSEWMGACGERLVIFNIKEEGIESRVRDMASDHGIRDYFMLDLSIPALIKMVRQGERRIAVRVSEYEPVAMAMTLAGKVDWAWIDVFHGLSLSNAEYAALRSAGFKLCLVSPELHDPKRESEIASYQRYISDNGLEFDAICTKYDQRW